MKSIIAIILITCSISLAGALTIKDLSVPATNSLKLRLLEDYSRLHWGEGSYRLKEPRMIVVHFTETRGIRQTADYFRRDTIDDSRLYKHGKINVGIHFLVDRDGSIYRFYPEDIIARHTIGFNHAALGMENIALDEKDETEAQLESDARLVAYLAKKYPTIKYLIGHMESDNRRLPHFSLYRELDPSYNMVEKPDPGTNFLAKLRKVLKDKYKIEFLD